MELYVVRGLKNNLLGLPAIVALKLMEKLCETETRDTESRNIEFMEQFPEVFTGLDTFGEEYGIKLKEDATPHAIYAPRSVPIPMRGQVKEELERMENLGVIQKVSEPIPPGALAWSQYRKPRVGSEFVWT